MTDYRYKADFVYLITSYKAPRQIKLLVQAIRQLSAQSLIVIHHDASRCSLDLEDLADDSLVILPFSINVEWGSGSQLSMHLQSLKWIHCHVEYNWLTLLSGEDFPVKPIRNYEKLLKTSNFDGFIYHWQTKNDGLIGRYDRHYFRNKWLVNSKIGYKLLSQLRRVFPKDIEIHGGSQSLSFKRRNSIFDEDFKCYKGSDWFALSNRAIQFVVEHGQKNPRILKCYLASVIPTESYFHSILANAKAFHLCPNNLRFIDWPKVGSSKNPNNLGMQHYKNITHSNFYFARKLHWDLSQELIVKLCEDLEIESLLLNLK